MKKFKSIIVNALIIVLAVMILGFGVGYYLAMPGDGIGGYQYLQRLQNRLSTANSAKVEVYLYIAGMIMVLIFASLLIVLALILLLCNFNVIKNKKVCMALNIAKIAVAVLTMVSVIMVLSSVISMTKISSVLEVGYGIITNMILSVLAVVAVVFEIVVDLVLSKKK